MLRIEMLPAGHGDCLWLEYGDPTSPRRVLIDGGTKGTYRRALRPRLDRVHGERAFELLVVTHIDADHIAGTLELLGDADAGFSARDIWFNGYRHLPNEAPETLGPVQGELLTQLLTRPGTQWNQAFGRGAVVVPAADDLPRVDLPDGLSLTLLSPAQEQLAELKPVWEKEVRKAGLDPTMAPAEEAEGPPEFELLSAGPPDVEELANEPFTEDSSEANGSSIALLAEYAGHRLLLAGDAHPGVLQQSIARLAGGGRLALDACKLPHHGSKSNVSRSLLDALDCQAYLFSTNGAYFRHPDRQAVARVIKWGGSAPRLTFNYRSRYNGLWGGESLQQEHGYTTLFPAGDAEGVVLEWA